MFGSKALLDILDFDSWKSKEKKELLEILKQVPEDVMVVVRSEKPVKGFRSETHDLPKPWEREKWLEYVVEKFEEKGLKISKEVAEYFLSMVGEDEYAIESEAEKLSLYSDGEVKIEDIEEVVHRSTHAAVDEFCFALSERRYEEAKKMLRDVLEGTDLLIVLASLAKHFEDLLKVRVKVPEKERYIWPDVSKYSKELGIAVPKLARFLGFKFKGWKNEPFNHVKEYSKDEITAILKKLFSLDRMAKISENPIVHLQSFIDSLQG